MESIRTFNLHCNTIGGKIGNIAANVGSREILYSRASNFKAFKHHFEQLSLLSIHRACLKNIDAKYGIFKEADIIFNEISSC